MTITIICPSPLVKDNDIKSIADDYIKRLQDKVVVQELNVKTKASDTPDIVKQKQGEAIITAMEKLTQNTAIVSLDERGKSYDSRQLATQLSNYQNNGLSDVCIIIGGAFGLSENVLKIEYAFVIGENGMAASPRFFNDFRTTLPLSTN